MILPLSFYQRDAVVVIAQELIGKWLFTNIDGIITGGMITETEAYAGPEDKASHAYNNRRTERTEVMFHAGGVAYVYLCYGIHNLLNVVTNIEGIPHAILIRATTAEVGIETMLKRRKKKKVDESLTRGPGSVCQALGIDRRHNGCSLQSTQLWIEDRSAAANYIATPRIGIDYAQEHALLPWRFISKDLLKNEAH